MSRILEIDGLRGGYLPGVDILQGVNLSVDKGEAVGVIGLNGSGKSTLGKAIMNMIPFRRGNISYMDSSIMECPTHSLARKGISIMHQGGQVFPNLSVWDNLELAFGGHLNSPFIHTIINAIPLLQASKRKLQKCGADQLSGGERHQLALAMTLAKQPKLMILDEPSAGLSPVSVGKIYDILSQIRVELDISLILIEQNIAKAIEFCDRCILLRQGQIVLDLKEYTVDDIEKIMFNK